MSLAPIILFVYNRPWHTEQTLNALMLNELADKSTLYIYCDGPKKDCNSEDHQKIQEVREVVRKKKWCKEVVIIEREDNIGLANSVIKGVTEVVNRHEKIIVLEDDIVTGKYFLKFMNDGLSVYKDVKEVYGISGYCFPYSGIINNPTFFLPIMSSWGYAIWLDSWKKINFNGDKLLDIVERKKLGNKLNFSNLNFYQMLKDQVAKKNNSWAIRFYVSMFLDNGFFLYPKDSLLINIGFDGTGVHCNLDENKIFSGSYKNELEIKLKKQKIQLNKSIIKKFQKEKKKASVKILKKIKGKLKKSIAPELIQLIRRKLKPLNKKGEVISLKDIPRYTKTTTQLLGRKIIIPDSASYLFMYKEIFIQEIYKFKTLNEEPYIIDGGANIGMASIYLKLLYPNSEIVAFEPDKKIYNILENNINSFNLRGIKLINKGLWDKKEKLSFYSEGADGGAIVNLNENLPRTESIEVVSLKPYLNKKVDFLKLDIEGAETIVLKEVKSDLINVERIFIEYHSFVGQKQTLDNVIKILTNANFRLYMSIPGNNSLNSPLLGLHNSNGMDLQLNIFGYKE